MGCFEPGPLRSSVGLVYVFYVVIADSATGVGCVAITLRDVMFALCGSTESGFFVTEGYGCYGNFSFMLGRFDSGSQGKFGFCISRVGCALREKLVWILHVGYAWVSSGRVFEAVYVFFRSGSSVYVFVAEDIMRTRCIFRRFRFFVFSEWVVNVSLGVGGFTFLTLGGERGG